MVKNVIMGAAGRDFHNFLTCYKDNANYRVVGFNCSPDSFYSQQVQTFVPVKIVGFLPLMKQTVRIVLITTVLKQLEAFVLS